MALPKFLQPYLASYDLSKLDVEEDKELIITCVLNYGNGKALRWLGKTYSQKEIKRVLNRPTPGMWLKEVLLYWLRIFNIKLSPYSLKKAFLDLKA